MISDPVAVLAVLTAVVWLSIQLHRRYRIFRSVGSVPVAILIAMVLSNLGLLPGRSEAYDFLRSTVVNLAIVLVLLSIDLRSIVRAGPRMLGAFAIGAGGTMVGATVAGLLLHRQVGPEAWKLSGMYTGTYVGGGVNFAALASAFETSGDLFSAAIAADVVVTNLWLLACLSIPVFLRSGAGSVPAGVEIVRAPGSHEPIAVPAGNEPESWAHRLDSSVRPILLTDVSALAAMGVALIWSAGRLAALVPVPQVLLLTTLVLLAAQVPPVKSVAGGAVWGNYLLQLFVAGNGAQCVIANIFAIGPAVFYFASITVAVHGILQFGGGRLLKIDAATLAVASQANVGGPATAIAIAGALGSTRNVLPGIAVGLLGYASGTYVGMAVGILVRRILGE